MSSTREKPVTKTFHYRIASFLHGVHTLSDLLTSAISNRPMARLRRMELDQQGAFIVLNRTLPLDGFVGCELCRYDRTTSPIAVEEDENAEAFPLAAVPLQGERQRYSESFAYIGAAGNSVVLCASRVIRPIDIERFLYWFLKDAIQPEQGGNWIHLNLPVHKSLQVDRLAKVSKVVINRAMHCGFVESPEEMGKFEMKGGDEGMLRTLLTQMGIVADERYRVSGPHNLRASLTLAIPGGANEAGLVLDLIAHDLRNHEELGYEIHLPSRKLTPKDLTVKAARSIDAHEGVPVAGDLFQKMNKWLISLAEEGKVTLE